MNDKDLKQLFGELKKVESQDAPSFEELLARPKPNLETRHKPSLTIPLFARIAVAASILLVTTFGIWQFSGLANPEPSGELALEEVIDTQQENILNWEPATDELLPTENSKTEATQTEIKGEYQSTNTTSNSLDIVLSEATEEMIEQNPELTEELFKNGSISDWTSPTDFLVSESSGFEF